MKTLKMLWSAMGTVWKTQGHLTIKDPMMKTLKMIVVTMKEMMKKPPIIPLQFGNDRINFFEFGTTGSDFLNLERQDQI